MDNVLIVTRNADKLNVIKKYLEQLAHFKVVTLSDVGQIQPVLASRAISVLVLDLDLAGKDALDILLHMNRCHATIPCIVACDRLIPVFSNLGDYETILRYIIKPFDCSQLAVSIFEALTIRDEEFSYWGMSVRSILPLIEITGITGCMNIQPSGENPGFIYFKNGRLLGAQYGDLEAEAAVHSLVNLSKVNITLTPLPQKLSEKKIKKGIIDLIGAHWSHGTQKDKKDLSSEIENCDYTADDIEPFDSEDFLTSPEDLLSPDIGPIKFAENEGHRLDLV